MSEVSSETNFTAKHTSPQEDPRVPDQDADTGGPRGYLSPPSKGPGSALSVARATAQRRESGDRLTSPQEFRRVLRQGGSRGAGGLVVHVLERAGRENTGPVRAGARLGLVVPRAVGIAVERNRVKRQIRVAWRELRPRVAPVDCVVVVRRRAVGTAFGELVANIERCLRSLNVLADPPVASGTA